MSTVMLMIATRENAANLLPLSDVALKPNSVCIAVTAQMKKEGKHEYLKQQIIAQGIRVEEYLEIRDELDVASLEEEFSYWLLENHVDDQVSVNLCGGLKTMSIAAYKVFSNLGARIFYAHYDGRIIWLDQPIENNFRLSPNIKLAGYLKTYHYEITSRKTLADISLKHKEYVRELYDYMHRHFDSFRNSISHLNYMSMPIIKDCNNYERSLAQNPKRQPHEPSLSTSNLRANSNLDDMLLALQYAGDLLRLTSKTLTFTDIEAAKIAGGGAWLDVMVADKLSAIAEVREVSTSVYFEKSTQRIGTAARNEMDVMALAGTQLLIVECKTVNWQGNADTSPLEAIYKLSALADIGGLNTKALLVSLYDLPDSAMTRARENGIEVIAGRRLLELPSLLQRWIAAN